MKRKALWAAGLMFLISSASLFGQWASAIGGTNTDRAYAACETRKGEYLLAGGTNSYGAGGEDLWLLKLTNAGVVSWGKTYGGSGDEWANSMEETSDGCYVVAGATNSFGAGNFDFWVLKLSANGGIKWQKAYGGSNDDFASSVQETIDGGYMVAGTTSSYGEGGSDIWLLKLDSLGKVEWQKTYGGSKDDGATSLERTIDGGYIVAGYTKSAGAGSYSMWVLKLTMEGDVEWQYAYGESNDDYAYAVKETIDGGFIVAGYTFSFGAGSADCWVLKLRDNGKIEWQKTYGGIHEDKAFCIRQDTDTGFIIAAQSYSFGVGNTGYNPDQEGDFLVFKLKADGSVKWQKTYGGNYSWDCGRFIRQTADGGYIAVGETCSWGEAGEWWSAGNKDLFMLKLLSNGNITSTCHFIGKATLAITDTAVPPHKTKFIPKNSKGKTEDTNIIQQLSSQKQLALGKEKCTLKTIISNGLGTLEPPEGTRTYNVGAKVTLRATPSNNYYFSSWNGNIHSSSSEVELEIDGDKLVTAEFDESGGGGGGGDWGGGGNYNKSYCFIATAAYSSPQHPHVRLLRSFRDRYLLPSSLGRKFVKAYYKLSPGVASFISGHAFLRNIVRIGLLPLVGLSFLFLQLGPIGAGIGLAAIFGLPSIFVWRRKRKKRRAKRNKK